LEVGFRRASEEAVEVTSGVGIEHLSRGKKLLLISDGGDQSVVGNR
jgi:hypothetical protein